MKENNMNANSSYHRDWVGEVVSHYEKEFAKVKKVEEAFENAKSKPNLNSDELRDLEAIQSQIHETNSRYCDEMMSQLFYIAMRQGAEDGIIEGHCIAMKHKFDIETPSEEVLDYVYENETLKVFQRYIDSFTAFFHASCQQIVPNIFILDWTTVNNNQPITAIFYFMENSISDTVNVSIKIFGLAFDPNSIFDFTASFDLTNKRMIFSPNFDEELISLHEDLSRGVINNETCCEIRLVLAMIQHMDFEWHFNRFQLNKMNNKLYCSIAMKDIELFGVKCGRPELFKFLDDETRDKLIELCVSNDRKDLAEILRQNKND